MARYIDAPKYRGIVDVNLQLSSKSATSMKTARRILAADCSARPAMKGIFQIASACAGKAVTEFLVFTAGDSNSIVQTIAAARENARMVRDQLTLELWED